MTVLDSGFHAVDSRFQVLDYGFLVSAAWLPDSKAQDSEFYEQKFPVYNPDYLTLEDDL